MNQNKTFYPSLVLNADFRPLSIYPLSVWTWQETIKAVFLDKVHVIALYDKFIKSPSSKFQLPSVIALKDYISSNRRPPLTRYNIFLRDRFICQYCTGTFHISDLTLDHVTPKSKGGDFVWENMVTACKSCNSQKADYMPEEIGMFPFHKPVQPSKSMLAKHAKEAQQKLYHESWKDFINW